ncbi:hypothetical protein GCM10018790_70390 [Kitasatospora xanthocidica]|nr:hypothetical protein GCM10018790_70390 [Kitasatospora xanthocidica]
MRDEVEVVQRPLEYVRVQEVGGGQDLSAAARQSAATGSRPRSANTFLATKVAFSARGKPQ